MKDEQQADALVVTTRDGVEVDIAPLVHAARNMRRNALQDAEQGVDTAVSRRDTGLITFGMQIAVSNLFGQDAGDAFAARLDGPA